MTTERAINTHNKFTRAHILRLTTRTIYDRVIIRGFKSTVHEVSIARYTTFSIPRDIVLTFGC